MAKWQGNRFVSGRSGVRSPLPAGTIFRSHSVSHVPVAQWIAHQTSDLGVGGSSPPWDLSFLLGNRQHIRANGVSVTLKLPKL